MYGHYLIETQSEPQWPTDPDTGDALVPDNWISTSDQNVYLYAEVLQFDELDQPLPPEILDRPELVGSTVIGGWAEDGVSLGHDNTAYTTIRPLGNYPPRDLLDEDGNVVGQTRGGDATDQLLYQHWAGLPVRRLGTGGALYPDDNQPFAIEVRHKYFGGNPDPNWDSWGWRAEFIGASGQRDPSARAIGIYRDAECTQFWYTTGAFSEQVSEWQDGSPTVWATEYNPGQLGEPSQVPVDVHHAVLLGSAQEGYQTLPGGDENAVSKWLYWDRTQGQQPGGQWQDTGSVVTQIYGAAVYGVDDDGPFQTMAADTPLRIGGEETTFTRIQSPGIIVVEDHNPNAVGETIFAQV